MGWNFEEETIRMPRCLLRAVVATVKEEATMEWPRVKLVLMRVFGRFPEARDAFVQAIEEAFESKPGEILKWAT